MENRMYVVEIYRNGYKRIEKIYTVQMYFHICEYISVYSQVKSNLVGDYLSFTIVDAGKVPDEFCKKFPELKHTHVLSKMGLFH